MRHDGRANPNQLLMTRAHAARDCGAARAARRRPPRAVRRERRRRPVRRPAAHALRPVRAPRGESSRSRWRPVSSRPRSAVSRRRPGAEDDELDRLIDDFVVAARLARGPASVRRRQAVSRLPGSRVAGRAHATRALRRLAGESDALPAIGHRGDSRHGAGSGDCGAPLRVRHGALPQGARRGRARAVSGAGRRLFLVGTIATRPRARRKRAP